MASSEPLVGKKKPHTKASIFYGADEYLEQLKAKYEIDHEIGDLKAAMPDGGDPHAVKTNKTTGKIAAVETNDAKRSLKTGRLLPVSNKPDPMPEELAFLFARVTPKQMMYMWNILTLIHICQWSCIVLYAVLLRYFEDKYYWYVTCGFGLPFAYLAIQNIYIDHDVMHGATFPPYWWQKYMTHCFSDFFSLPWEDFVLEHNRHHASTQDLLLQGEFGWDPEEMHYFLQQWACGKWYWWMMIFTVPAIPFVHFVGLNDTGAVFAIEWYFHFPEGGTGGKCNKEFWKKWLPRRVHHHLFVASVWTMIWLIGTYPINRPLSEGWRFMLTVSCFGRLGFGLAWMFITNFTHSLPWNRFLTSDPDRSWPILHSIMAWVLGGRHRWNEMLFHDLHHAFPNAVGTLSQRGRFHGWKKVYDAAVEVLHRGIWVKNSDEDTEMMKMNKKRSALMKSNKGKK